MSDISINNNTNITTISSLLPSDYDRLLIDLEFLQNLTNFLYLHQLAQQNYFEDINFINYLKYLFYLKQSKYIYLIKFSSCFIILNELISNKLFQKDLLLPSFVYYAHQQQGLSWLRDRYYIENNNNNNNTKDKENDNENENDKKLEEKIEEEMAVDV